MKKKEKNPDITKIGLYAKGTVEVRSHNKSIVLCPTKAGEEFMYTVQLKRVDRENAYKPACRHEVLRDIVRETTIGLTEASIEHLFVAHILSKYGETQAKFAAMFVQNLKSSNDGCPESQGSEKNK